MHVNLNNSRIAIFLSILLLWSQIVLGIQFGNVALANTSLPDGEQTFAGYTIANGVATSPDGNFQLRANRENGDLINNILIGTLNEAYINNNALTSETVYFEVSLSENSTVKSFELGKVFIGNDINININGHLKDVIIEGYSGSEKVFSTQPYSKTRDDGIIVDFPIDYSPASGKFIDSFRIYYTTVSSNHWSFAFYKFSILNASTASSDEINNGANLSDLSLSNGSLNPVFDPKVTNYSATVPNEVNTIDIAATAVNLASTIKVNNIDVISGEAIDITLHEGVNFITVEVTSEYGIKKTYTIRITREGTSETNLDSISLSSGTLNPAFDPNITSYSVNVGYEIDHLDIAAIAASESISNLHINEVSVSSGESHRILLDVGINTITIKTTTQDNKVKVYAIDVFRLLSSNANLSNITLNQGTLSPSFSPEITS